jgi:5-hydroxyisourate hydrolase
MSSVSTHVLDAVSGGPATGVPITLIGANDAVLAVGHTDADGRNGDLGQVPLEAGVYRLRFDTAAYFAAIGISGFYPEVVITFEITDDTAKYHVPLLLSPYAYSTYRGS